MLGSEAKKLLLDMLISSYDDAVRHLLPGGADALRTHATLLDQLLRHGGMDCLPHSLATPPDQATFRAQAEMAISARGKY